MPKKDKLTNQTEDGISSFDGWTNYNFGGITVDGDWRLLGQERYLFGKKLIQKTFVTKKQRDHAHCAFCWDKIGDCEDWIRVAYCTSDELHWICEQCYQDFRESFQWQL